MVVDRFTWLKINAVGRILDVGSAGAHTFGGRAVNLDLDLYHVPNFVRGDAHNLPFVDNSFDTVCLGDVLEHVDDPLRVLLEAKRVAKLILITVPDEKDRYLERMMSEVYESDDPELHRKAVEKWIRDNRPVEIIDDKKRPHLFHRRFFTEQELIDLLEKAGLEYEIQHVDYGIYRGWYIKAWRKEDAQKKEQGSEG